MADTLWYAPLCRSGEHTRMAHHDRLNDRCDCPCHLDRPGTPWWSDHQAAKPAKTSSPETGRG